MPTYYKYDSFFPNDNNNNNNNDKKCRKLKIKQEKKCFPLIAKISLLTWSQKDQPENQHAGRKIEILIKWECCLIFICANYHQEEECF